MDMNVERTKLFSPSRTLVGAPAVHDLAGAQLTPERHSNSCRGQVHQTLHTVYLVPNTASRVQERVGLGRPHIIKPPGQQTLRLRPRGTL